MAPGAGKTRGQLTPVGGTLAGLLQGLGLTATLKGWEALSVWAETVGSPASERSRAVAFESGRLIVEVESSAWMTQLSFLKRDIRARLNRRLGGDVIQDIQFTPRGGETARGGDRNSTRKDGPGGTAPGGGPAGGNSGGRGWGSRGR